jgi:hypothetical protein
VIVIHKLLARHGSRTMADLGMIIEEAQRDAAARFEHSGTGLLEVSHSGSEMGATTRARLRSNAVTVCASRSLTSTDSP